MMRFLLLLLTCIVFIWSNVDINSASLEELQTLRGIGAKKAKAIITYRKTHCFKTVDDLAAVKGIGKKTIEKNRSNITVGKCDK